MAGGLYSEDVKMWKYHVTSIKLFTESGGTMDLPAIRLKEMQIMEDFTHYLMPIFKIVMTLEPDAYYTILKNKDGGKIYLRIDQYYLKPNSNKKSMYRTFINDTFDLILDDSTEDLLYSQNTLINKADYKNTTLTNKNSLRHVANDVEFFLFKTSSIEGIKANNVNVLLREATIADAVGYLMTKAGIRDVLFAQPDNTKVYDLILIPPLPMLKAFQYLDTYYGMYRSGTLIYFGIQYVYVIPYNGSCAAYVNGEKKKTTIVIPKTSDTYHTTTLGELKADTDARYIVADYKTLSARNESISNNYILGNDVTVMDSYSGSSYKSESSATAKTKNFVKILENSTENAFIGDMYTAQTKSGSSVLTANFQDIDISCIAPNKEYQLLYEESKFAEKYKGQYIITSALHTFSNTGEDLSVNSQCEFRNE